MAHKCPTTGNVQIEDKDNNDNGSYADHRLIGNAP